MKKYKITFTDIKTGQHKTVKKQFETATAAASFILINADPKKPIEYESL